MEQLHTKKITLRPYQHDTLERIVDNINNGVIEQTITMPTGSGKTTIATMLAGKLATQGLKVMLYKLMPPFSYREIILESFDKEICDSILFLSGNEILSYKDDTVDIIISDDLLGVFDNDILTTDFSIRIDQLANKSSEFGMSMAQKTAINIQSLKQLLINNNACHVLFSGVPPIAWRDKEFSGLTGNNVNFVGCDFNELEEWTVNSFKESARSNKSIEEKKNSEILSLTYFMENFGNKVLSKLDTIDANVSKIKNMVEELGDKINIILNDKKNTIATYKEIHTANDEESEKFISKMLEQFSNNVIQEIKSKNKTDQYTLAEHATKESIGEDAWNKMSNDSKKLLSTAKMLLIYNYTLSGTMDFSSICILASKSVEIEIAKRFVKEYKQYLTENGYTDFDWPPALYSRKPNNEPGKLLTEDEFTMGNLPYIMGFYGQDKHINANRCRDYCSNKLFNDKANVKLDESMNYINSKVLAIKNNYRDSAAHKSVMNIEEAKSCMDFIIDVEKTLRKILEMFNF